MKKNNVSVYSIGIILLLLMPVLLFAQSLPKITTYSNFKCEVYIEIYNGLYDWHGGNNYSGGSMPLSDGEKTEPGAATVANKNDTDGDGMVDGGSGETDVRPGSPALGRNEVDLIKIVIKKVNPSAILTGNVEIKITGDVKIWTEPWKGMEIPLPYTFPASQLDETVYLEALEASAIKGIEVEVVYNGKSDVAKATAVWVTRTQYWRENTSLPIPGPESIGGTLKTLETEFLYKRINNTLISTSGNRYGHGEFNRGKLGEDTGPNDKRFGGRILFEFSVFPKEAARVVQFDITRQRKTRTGKHYYAISPNFFPDPKNTDFPNDPSQNKDNELPNDDSDGGDEDNTPNLSFIYSIDPPGTVKKSIPTYKTSGEISDTTIAFKVSKNSFREFVRIQIKPAGFPFKGQDEVFGSRASDHNEWHCTYYAKRFGDENMLIGDYNVVSSSIPLKYKKTYTGNGIATVSILTSDVSTDNFFLSYTAAQNQWYLSNSDITGGIGESGPPAADGSWTVTLNGVTVVVQPGSIPFQNEFTWVFNTFRTMAPSGAKINEIDINFIEPDTGY
ncbi:MAG: hypothetical protein ACKVUS_17580 [Saprospiraceae bacterium]